VTSKQTAALRLLIADDQQLVRAGFRKLLDGEEGLEVVGEAADGIDAIGEARRLRPHVILMDIRMPRLDGIEATRQIVATCPDIAVLILTTYDLDEYVFHALSAGASGFLLKDTPPDDLIDGIRIVARGDALLAPTVTRRLIAEFTSAVRARTPAQLPEISGRERDVLVQVTHGLNNAEIAAALFIGEATVKTHVSNLLSKLGCRDRVQLVVRGYEAGLVVPGTR
jgi:DNA-binding NarL/FixJ family response regulator